MRINFYKYILVFFFIFSCTTIDELHGIDNLKIKSESLQANITNSNDVLNLIGPPQNVGHPFDEASTISLGKDPSFLSSFLASMRQRAKNFGKTND